MEEARADEGFQFVKGKSHSKRCVDPDDSQPTPKRCRCSKDLREERMKNIEEDCKDINDHVSFKKRIRACENMSDYKKCDELKEEILLLKQQRCELQSELKRLERVAYQSAWYYRKKARGDEVQSEDVQMFQGTSSSSDRCRSSSFSDRSRSTTPLPLSRSRSATPSTSSPLFRPHSAFGCEETGEPPFPISEMAMKCTWSDYAPLSLPVVEVIQSGTHSPAISPSMIGATQNNYSLASSVGDDSTWHIPSPSVGDDSS